MTSILPSRPAEHQPDRGAVAGRHQLDRGLRQPGVAQAVAERGLDGAARAQTVRAAAQDRGIAGFQAERAGIGGHIGPALVDDADDAERHPDALDGHAVRPRPGFGDGADRVLEGAHRVDAGGHGLDAAGVERQAVEKSAGHAGGARFGDVLGIGGQDCAVFAPARRRPCARARGPSAPWGQAPARGRRRGRGGRSRPWRRRYRPFLQCF